MSLREQSVSGAKWNTAASVNMAIVQVVKLMVLAHFFLSKTDFGLWTTTLMIVGFVGLFASMGFTVGIIHKQNITQKQYSSLFWVNLLLSIILFGLLCLLAPLLANFYGQPLLKSIIPLTGIGIVFSALGKTFFAIKNKEMDFKFLSIASIISVETGAIATVIFAFYDFGVYSLVYGNILQVLVLQFMYVFAGLKLCKIQFYCSLREIKDFIKIGGFQLGTQVIDYLAMRIDIFIIGRFFNIETLGVYGLAKDLIERILQIINSIITSVATPAFARFQHQKELVQQRYLKMLRIVATIDFPICVVLALFSQQVTLIMYSADKIGASPFLTIFAIWGFFYCVIYPGIALTQALGRTDKSFMWSVIRIILTSIAVLIGSFISIEAVAWAQVLVTMFLFFFYWRFVIYPISQIKLKNYLKSILKPCLFALASSIPVLYFAFIAQQIYMAIMAVAIYGVVYLSFNYVGDKDFFKEMLSLVIHKKEQK